MRVYAAEMTVRRVGGQEEGFTKDAKQAEGGASLALRSSFTARKNRIAALRPLERAVLHSESLVEVVLRSDARSRGCGSAQRPPSTP